jgi:hypothetical protein
MSFEHQKPKLYVVRTILANGITQDSIAMGYKRALMLAKKWKVSGPGRDAKIYLSGDDGKPITKTRKNRGEQTYA